MKLQLLKVEEALHSYLCARGFVCLSVLIGEVASYSDQFLTLELTAGHSAEKSICGVLSHIWACETSVFHPLPCLRKGHEKTVIAWDVEDWSKTVGWTEQDQCIVNSQQLWLPACDSAREYSSMKGRSQIHFWLSHHIWLLGEEKSILFKDKVSGKPATLWWLAPHPEVTGQRKLGLYGLKKQRKLSWEGVVADLGGARSRNMEVYVIKIHHMHVWTSQKVNSF